MKRNRGFTLVELMVALAVLAILLGISIPSYREFVANNRMTAQANDLISAFSLARSEAVKRAANVTVCVSSDGASCTGGVNWEQGWIVTADTADPNAVIRMQQALGGNSTLTIPAATNIVFNATGATTLAANTTLTLCPPAPAIVQGRVIQIERSGRPRADHLTANCP